MAIERLFVGEGVKEVEVKKYLVKELKRAGLASIIIQRTPLVTRIVIYCDRPALVIGRKGSNVKEITRLVEQNYKIEKPEIEVKKVDNPNLEPNIIAYRIASALERGMHSRKVGYKALQAVMRSGAKGAEIVMSGKLVGKGGRSRVLKMKAGYLKKCGRPAIEQVRHGQIVAACKPGVIGVSVSVVPGNVHFPDEINIIKPEDFKIEEEIVEVTEEPAGEKKEATVEKKEEKKPAQGSQSEPVHRDQKVPREQKAEKPKEEPKAEVKAEVKSEVPKPAAKKEAPKEKKEGPKKMVKKLEEKEEKKPAVKKAVKKEAKPKAEKKTAAKKPAAKKKPVKKAKKK